MFERYVAGTRTNWQRAPWIVAAVFAHVLIGGFIYACTLLEVEEIRPPAIGVMILRAPPPPPPLPPALGVKVAKKHDATPTPKKPRVRKIVEPMVQPPAEPPPKAEPEAKADEPDDAEDEEEGDPDGVVGGAKNGVQGGNLAGVQGGQLGAPAPGVHVPAPEAPKPPPKMVASFVFDKERLSYPEPHLPESFKQQHPHEKLSGLYRICVGTDGHITKMTTEKSISGVDRDIIQQVQGGWIYKPQPIDVCMVRQFVFLIN
jgi:protein TonB